MNVHKYRKILLLILLVSSYVSADTATFEWTTPTTRVDRSPLSIGEISGYLIKYYCDTSPLIYLEIKDGGQIKSLISGVNGKCYFSIQTIGTQGLRSEWSPWVNHTYLNIKLHAPRRGGIR